MILDNLKGLEELFSQMEEKAKQVASYAQETRFLSTGLMDSMIALLEETRNQQSLCSEELSRSMKQSVKENMTLFEIRDLWQRYEEASHKKEMLIKARSIFKDFSRICSADEKYDKELKAKQKDIAALTDEQIYNLDYDKEVVLYGAFFQLSQEPDCNKIAVQAVALEASFSAALLMGLFLKKYHVAEQAEESDKKKYHIVEQAGESDKRKANPKKSPVHKVPSTVAVEPLTGNRLQGPISAEWVRDSVDNLYRSSRSQMELPVPMVIEDSLLQPPPKHSRDCFREEPTLKKFIAKVFNKKTIESEETTSEEPPPQPSPPEVVAVEAHTFEAPKIKKSRRAGGWLEQADPNLVYKEDRKALGISPEMDSKKLAQKLLTEGVTPEHVTAYQELLHCLLKEGRTVCENGQVENSLAQALVLSRALACYHPFYEEFDRQLTLATDSPLSPHLYEGDTISTLFEGEMKGSALHLAALLRAIFAPDMQYDYSLAAYAKSVFNDFHHCFSRFRFLKSLYNLFVRISEEHMNGFSIGVLRSFGNKQTEQRVLSQIKQDATQLLKEPTIKSRLNALIPMIALCFGQSSDLHACMEIIAADHRESRETVQLVLAEYCTGGNDKQQAVSMSKIEEAVNENWKKSCQGIRAPRELISTPRTKIIDGIQQRLALMRKWLDVTEENLEVERVSSTLLPIRNELLREIDSVLREIPSLCTPEDGTILKNILGSIHRKLNGQLEGMETIFYEFLRTGFFIIEAGGLPLVEKQFSVVEYYEPWRNALGHIAAPVANLKEILSRITDLSCPSLYDNIGQAVSICKLLNTEQEGSYEIDQYEADIPRAKRMAEDTIHNFKGELELSFAYGRISETLREDLFEQLDFFAEIFMDANGFACLRSFLEAQRQIVEKASKKRYLELKDDILSRMNSNHRPELEGILNVALEKLEEPERNFVVAEEYINRFDTGGLSELDIDKQNEESTFLHFVSDWNFEHIFSICRNNQRSSIRNFGVDFIERELKKRNISAQYQESSKLLIRNVPNIPEEATPGAIKILLTEIGFTVKGVASVSSTGTMIRLSAEVQATPKDNTEYAHPVDLMGTKMVSPIDVICLFGKMQANDIVDRVCSLELSRTAIVLLNGAVDLPGRRQIAERFHREKSGQNPFLLVDWVLLLYLALFQRTERFPVFLCCSLPYTSSFQPFVIDGSVPDEMFIGRKRELNRILDGKGSVIVYGGRQLGKTALLERALSRANHPEKKEYAVMITSTAMCTNESALAKMITGGLLEDGLELRQTDTLYDLCEELHKKYMEKAWKRLLVLIDEADTVLARFQKTEPPYKPIIPLCDLKRKTGNDFKFVLAGLHNVCRAANDPNTIFGRMGEPLCIQPLTPVDALELLSRPLRYMGFKLSASHLEHILVNTSFYPGIVHYVGYSLVENLFTRYNQYYQASHGNPPYELTDKQLGVIMSSGALNDKINERIRWTLSADPRYFMLARCIAYLYYAYPEDNRIGYTVALILEYAALLDISILQRINVSEGLALLLELVDMGILVRPTENTFRLRQRRFLDAIGNSIQKIEEQISEEEENMKNGV